jgi:hypothetical protein
VRLGSSDVFLFNSSAVGGRAVRKKWTHIHLSLSHIRSSKVGDNNAPLAKLQQSISRVEAARAKWSLFQEARGASAWLEVLEWTKYLSAGQTPKILSALLLLPEMTFTFDARAPEPSG